MVADWVVTVPVVAGVPSPQFTLKLHGPSAVPRSVKVALYTTICPGRVLTSAPASTAGGTFVIVALAVALSERLPGSVAVTVAVKVPLSA